MIRAIVIAGYIAIVAAAILVELYSRNKPEQLAPMGEMLEHVMRRRTVRIAVIAAWWWFGWHFLFAPTVQTEL